MSNFHRSIFSSGLATAAIVGVMLAAGAAFAADFKTSTTRDGRVVISITGEIVAGDAASFQAAVKTVNDAGKMATSVRLSSIGGNLVEGVKLAEAVRYAKVATNVGSNATCASACFLVFAAGETKFVNYSAQIGVHGASDKAGEETVQSGAATVSMARIAKELGVPSSIIGRMVVTPPSDMVWLSPADLQSMGTTMVGKPSQTAAVSAAPNAPMPLTPQVPDQVSPSAKATAPTSWDEMIKLAIARSADQNNGKPIMGRTCQPELKICYSGVFYTDNNGVETVLKIVRDMNDKVIGREACTFNKSGDIRKCYDWDKGFVHRDMKDSEGNWKKVADE